MNVSSINNHVDPLSILQTNHTNLLICSNEKSSHREFMIKRGGICSPYDSFLTNYIS